MKATASTTKWALEASFYNLDFCETEMDKKILLKKGAEKNKSYFDSFMEKNPFKKIKFSNF